MGKNTFLHIAVSINHEKEVRRELARNLDDLTAQNHEGDQPAHIAARLGHIDCLKVLIEYDAPMGRRNFAGLTPIGEARVNNQKDVVQLINAHYAFRTQTVGEIEHERIVYRR